MGIRTVKPTSAARRYLTYVTYEEITKTEPEKKQPETVHLTPEELRKVSGGTTVPVAPPKTTPTGL